MGIAVLGPLLIDDRDALTPRDQVVLEALVAAGGSSLSTESLAEALWGETPPVSWKKPSPAASCGSARCSERGLSRRHRTATVSPRTVTPSTPSGSSTSWTGATPCWWRANQTGPGTSCGRRWGCGEVGPSASWPTGSRANSRPSASTRCAGRRRRPSSTPACGPACTPRWSLRPGAGSRPSPLRERRWALLSLAQYLAGDQADALDTLRRARRRLSDELGLDPGTEITSSRQPSFGRTLHWSPPSRCRNPFPSAPTRGCVRTTSRTVTSSSAAPTTSHSA